MLSAHAIALQGIGYSTPLVALQGFLDAEPSAQRKRKGVPKDVLELYVMQQLREIQDRELEVVLKKAEKVVTREEVLASREKALPARPTEEDIPKAVAAILKRAQDDSLAKARSRLAKVEIEARNEEDILLMIL